MASQLPQETIELYERVLETYKEELKIDPDYSFAVQLPPIGYIFSFFQVLLRFALQRKGTTSENGREMREISAILLRVQGMFCTNCG